MKTIGIVAAMEEEIKHIIAGIDVKVTRNAVGMDFYVGTYQGKNLVAVWCGIGKVNAAICAQVLIDLFAVDYIINTGVAGGIDNKLETGDIIVSVDALHHDMDATGFGYKLGEIPRMSTSIFEADEVLVDIAVEQAEALGFDTNIFKGRVATGDQFIASPEKKRFIWDKFSASCVEMEGAAIAQTCTLNKIPFVIIRAISDKADGSAGTDYNKFIDAAVLRSAQLVEKMLEKF